MAYYHFSGSFESQEPAVETKSAVRNFAHKHLVQIKDKFGPQEIQNKSREVLCILPIREKVRNCVTPQHGIPRCDTSILFQRQRKSLFARHRAEG